MLSDVILQEDTTAENASLMGKKANSSKSCLQTRTGTFQIVRFMASDRCFGECKDKRGTDLIIRVKRGYLYSAGGICMHPVLFLSTEENLTQTLTSKAVITTSFSTAVEGRGNHPDLWEIFRQQAHVEISDCCYSSATTSTGGRWKFSQISFSCSCMLAATQQHTLTLFLLNRNSVRWFIIHRCPFSIGWGYLETRQNYHQVTSLPTRKICFGHTKRTERGKDWGFWADDTLN